MRDLSIRQSKILIIDDEPMTVEILRQQLSLEGYLAIEGTSDSLAAVRVFRDFQPDLVILDWRMPGLAGWEVLAALRAIIKTEALLPILVVTGDSSMQTRREALARGASDFLIKPYDTPEIMARIGNLLEARLAVRHQAEAAQRESDERFFSAFNHAPIGMGLVALNGRWFKVNPALCELVGYSEAELLARTFTDVTHPDDVAPDEESIRRLMAGELRVYQRQKRYLHKSGRSVTILLSVSLVRDLDGAPRYFIGQMQDYTERQAAQTALQESRHFLRSTLDALSSHIAILDEQGNIVEVNLAWRRFAETNDCAGAPRGVGDNYLDLWDAAVGPLSEEAPLVAEGIRAVMAGRREEFQLEYPCHGAEEQRWFLLRVTRFGGAGPIRVVVAHEDVTGRKKAKLEIERLNAELEQRVTERTESLLAATRQAESANNAKSDFLSRISHELRTPMNAILGFGQLLEMEEDLRPESRESIEQILLAGRHLLTLINEMLDLSSAEAGRLALALESVAIEPLIEESLELVRPLALPLGIVLPASTPAWSSWVVLADRARLQQVLLNLLANAVKYNRPGGAVSVECIRAPATILPSLRLSVIDTGHGISPEKIVRLFRPFDRLDAERARDSARGTGLGLALSKQVVELMGGALGVESGVGVGSRFWVEIPLAENPNEQRDTETRT